jgi:XTP/dITP diphosphohydrolase
MTVVLVDPRRPSLVPVEAINLLAGEVQYTEEMPIRVPWSLPAARPCSYDAADDEGAPVLLSSDREHPAVRARLAAGERLIAAPGASSGERLVDAVAMMDKLRTSGPWESQQTHDSLRRYLLEETYEVFDAVRSGNADDLRDELGDVLLQVLFHARKLVKRVPAVLAGEEISLEDQLAQWEERKAMERSKKGVRSVMDDVPTGQPALALAQKVLERATAAGVPADLIPGSMTSVSVAPHVDTENTLRSSVLEFMDTVRTTELAVAAHRRGADVPNELDVASLGDVTEDVWRAHWLGAVTDPGPESAQEPESTAVDASDDAEGGEIDDELEDQEVVVGGAGGGAVVESR